MKKAYKITSRHNSLTEALKVAGYDSTAYNEREFRSAISSAESSSRGCKFLEAIVTDEVEYNQPVVLYVIEFMGCKLIHHFSVSAMLTNSPFSVYEITDNLVEEFAPAAGRTYTKEFSKRKQLGELIKGASETFNTTLVLA